MKGHTTARIGKRLKVFLKDGTSFVDKLAGIKSGHYEFETIGKVETRKIRSLSINRR